MIEKLLGNLYWQELEGIINVVVGDKQAYVPRLHKGEWEQNRAVLTPFVYWIMFLEEIIDYEGNGLFLFEEPHGEEAFSQAKYRVWNKTQFLRHLEKNLPLLKDFFHHNILLAISDMNLTEEGLTIKEWTDNILLEQDLQRIFEIWAWVSVYREIPAEMSLKELEQKTKIKFEMKIGLWNALWEKVKPQSLRSLQNKPHA